jgi:hypothetical protein
MKLNVIFGKKNIDYFSTNTHYIDSIRSEIENKKNRIISYTLNDLPLTQKFIEYWQIYRKNVFKKLNNSQFGYNINYYPNSLIKTTKDAIEEMNLTINEMKNLGYKIDDSLYLNDNLSSEDFVKKLNELHFIFEKESSKLNNLRSEVENRQIIRHELEKINNLVHFLEKGLTENFAISIRTVASMCSKYYNLEDEDYKDFIMPSGGDLVCDFATVGKDLWYCSMSNDIDLIRKKEVKQQTQLTDFIFLNFQITSPEFNNKKFTDHYKWCKNNRVDQYIDYKLPKYSPGRHVLGKIDEPIYTGYDFYKKIISETPAFIGYYLTYDNGELLITEI